MFRKTLIVSVSILLASSLLSGCAGALPGGTGECSSSVDNAHKSTTKPGYIDGKSKFKCVFTSGSITDLSITTKLQKLSGGAWVDISGTSNTTTKATVKTGVTYTGVSGFITCRTGTFRTAGRGSAYLNGVFSGSSVWEYSGSTVNPCG